MKGMKRTDHEAFALNAADSEVTYFLETTP